MRPRKWVLLLAIFLLGLSCALYLVKRRFERNRNLENLLIDAVSSINQGSFSVGAVRIGFFSVYLHRISVTLPSSPAQVRIKKIKVGLSFVKLLKHHGDIAQSINQIILIEPQITLSLFHTNDTLSTPYSKTLPTTSVEIDDAPANYLYVKNGTINLIDARGDTLTIAKKLAGELLRHPHETGVSLNGTFGSTHRNFSLQGSFGWRQNKHHLSIRLTNAHLEQPVYFSDAVLNTGTLNGAVECTFTSQLQPKNTELHGWLQLTHGNMSLTELLPAPFDSIVMRISFENSSCYLNTVSAQYRSIPVVARGSFSFLPVPATQLHLSAATISPDSLSGLLPDSLLSGIDHPFSVNTEITWKKGADVAFSSTADSVSFNRIRLNKLYGKGYLSETRLFVDTLIMRSDFLTAIVGGFADLDSGDGAYDIGFNLILDSLPKDIPVSGDIRAIGNITGSRHQTPTVSSRIYAKDLEYNHIYLGNPQLVASFTGNSCTFNSVDIDTTFQVVLDGSIDSIFTGHPNAVFNAIIGSNPIKRQLMRIQNMPPVDSVHCHLSGNGWLTTFTSTIDMYMAMEHFSGTVRAQLDRHAADTGDLIWNISSQDILIRQVPVSFTGRGAINESTITIDTLSGDKGIGANATLFYEEQPPRFDAFIRYDMSVSDLMRFFPEEPPFNKGRVQGSSHISGTTSNPSTASMIIINNGGIDSLEGFDTQLSIFSEGTDFTILPAKITRNGTPVLTIDTISRTGEKLRFSARFDNLTPRMLLGNVLPDDVPITASISGNLQSTENGLPAVFYLTTPVITYDTIQLDSIKASGMLSEKGIAVARLTFNDGKRSRARASGFIPWNMLGDNAGEKDTLRGSLSIKGDLLATIEKNISSPIGGTGQGTADFAFYSTDGDLTFTRGSMSLPQGILEVRPFVPDKVKNFTFALHIDSTANVHTDMSGTIKKKPIRIFSTHALPDSYEPLMIGPLNFGAFQVETPKKGVDLHLPGFMAGKERGGIDFQGKKPFDNFTISGPLDRLKLSGTWILRDMEFTFPFLKNDEVAWRHDPFPYVTWEMDVTAGNRRVMYFWDFAAKKNRIMRFVEGYLDLSSIVKLSGRDLDKTFRIDGIIRSYKGAAYYGRVFNRNFDVGVEFNPIKSDKNSGYNNIPLLWGSAETFSDTSRQARITLTCMVVDPTTGAMSEKGRLADQSVPNLSFQLSSELDELPDQQEREMYQEAGISISTIGGAGSAVSDFGEQMFHRYLLQRWERRIAKKLGLDVINIETSIVSNYFNKLYSRQFDGLLNEDDYLALANVGVTVGRYFFRDFLFLKARGELIPIDMALTPEYSIGFEFQPSRFITMDVNYGFHKTETVIQHSPLLSMQLRLPIRRLRNLLNF